MTVKRIGVQGGGRGTKGMRNGRMRDDVGSSAWVTVVNRNGRHVRAITLSRQMLV